ncbi:hypothetical protein C8034_v004062 [Colletotrichum sidae]|uniref:Uncharacterized protein n=1 Tax=Colletotrichum sidae TaxID=1347389 RepID=A0A4R8TAB5_9PEZI|nr:hypothetical protein C8034_v004062 [Colletotrichum sidae]
MDERAGEGLPSAQKFIFSRPEERKIRRRFIWSAFFFDAIAIALVLPLCVGGWVLNPNAGGIVNSEDAHLVTWSAPYRRSGSQRESTLVMTWFLSSCCFEEAKIESGVGLAGCIHRTPGSPFDLESILEDMELKLADLENMVADSGNNAGFGREGAFQFAGPTDVDYASAPTVGSTKDALASYGIYLAINMGTWSWQIMSKKHRYPLKASSWRVMAAAQTLALFALLVASGVTTASAYKANDALAQLSNVFTYHAIGNSFAALTWIAFVSHLFGTMSYTVSVFIWNRLQRPELYPPEPEDEEARLRRQSTRGPGNYRSHRLGEAGVHREVDPDAAVDDELPPYSRVDPNERGSEVQATRTSSEHVVNGPPELAYLRRAGPTDHAHGEERAPAYELHPWPANGGERAS